MKKDIILTLDGEDLFDLSDMNKELVHLTGHVFPTTKKEDTKMTFKMPGNFGVWNSSSECWLWGLQQIRESVATKKGEFGLIENRELPDYVRRRIHATCNRMIKKLRTQYKEQTGEDLKVLKKTE